jgi:murein DD-endopeptidase MepM/ murein hydrolase activator NlpD
VTPFAALAVAAALIAAPTATVTPRPSIAPTPEPTPIVDAADLAALRAQTLLFPVPTVRRADAPDTFADARGGRPHEALDIPAARGAPVVAVADGTIVKLFTSVPGGLTIYLFDRDRRFAFYYAHLDAYAPDLHEGQEVRRGDVLGSVGTTGNAAPASPHLHFAIFKLEPTPRWWHGTPIDPHPLLTGP